MWSYHRSTIQGKTYTGFVQQDCSAELPSKTRWQSEIGSTGWTVIQEKAKKLHTHFFCILRCGRIGHILPGVGELEPKMDHCRQPSWQTMSYVRQWSGKRSEERQVRTGSLAAPGCRTPVYTIFESLGSQTYRFRRMKNEHRATCRKIFSAEPRRNPGHSHVMI